MPSCAEFRGYFFRTAVGIPTPTPDLALPARLLALCHGLRLRPNSSFSSSSIQSTAGFCFWTRGKGLRHLEIIHTQLAPSSSSSHPLPLPVRVNSFKCRQEQQEIKSAATCTHPPSF